MPYLVPAWALATMGASTTQLPRKMVRTACHQLMPSAISDEASMYVGTHADIEIQSAAMSFIAHLRSLIRVGARSWLLYGERISPSTSWIPPTTRTVGAAGAGLGTATAAACEAVIVAG